MFKPLSIVRNKTRGSWSVCLWHEESEKRYWVDVSLDEKYHDLDIDWNQYIFDLNYYDQIERKAFQEDCDNFDEISSEAVVMLEAAGEIFHGEDGDWYLKGEWKGEDAWMIA
jgi:hypothetical protein